MERQRFLEAVKARGRVSVITHNDPDGILAAAIAIKALEDAGIEDVSTTFESPSSVQRGKSSFLDPSSDDFVGGFIILLDLPHHPSANLWIDHHASEGSISPAPSTAFVVHDTSQSAAALTLEFFRERLGFTGKLCDERFLAFVNARDMGIDPGVVKKEHELFSMAVHEDRNDYPFFFELIDALVDEPGTAWMATMPAIVTKSKRQKKRLAKGGRELQRVVVSDSLQAFLDVIDVESDKEASDQAKHRVFLYKGFLFFDFSDVDSPVKERDHGISIPYFTIVPGLRQLGLDYNFLLVYRGDDKTGDIHCTLSINQARTEILERHDASDFAKSRGGGGHGYVAGFVIAPESFFETIRDIAAYFGLT